MPAPPPEKGVGGRVRTLWGHGKTTLFKENDAKHMVKLTFYEVVISRAVRKGGLLRGMVSQGSTSPLKPCVKG